MTGASNVSTDKMLNLPKASDSEETKQEKEKTDVVKRHGEESSGAHATTVSGPSDDKPDKVIDGAKSDS